MRFAWLGWLCLASVPVLAQPSGHNALKQNELDAVHRQIDLSKSRERRLSADMAALEREAAEISRRMIAVAAEIQAGEARATASEARVGQLNSDNARLGEALRLRRANLSMLLASLQKLKRNPPPPLAARPRDAADAVRAAILLGGVAKALEVERTALSRDLARLDNVRAALAREQRQLDNDIRRLRRSQDELRILHNRKLAMSRTAQQELREEREQARALAEKAQDLRQLLAELDARRQKTRLAQIKKIEDNKRAAEIARFQARAEHHRAETRRALAETARREAAARKKWREARFSRRHGQVPFPAQGRRVKQFGDEMGLAGRAQGLYIATRAAAQVIAPAHAYVEFAGPFRSYGQLLILNVGDGYHVLLAGLGEITTRTGQYLDAGEPVGLMSAGSTRGTLIGGRMDSEGPVLYVEFRKSGGAIDPSPWWIGTRKEARH